MPSQQCDIPTEQQHNRVPGRNLTADQDIIIVVKILDLDLAPAKHALTEFSNIRRDKTLLEGEIPAF